jgi:hypothetical protein
MAEILNPTGMMMSGGDGGLGFGSGGGLIGGLILGTLLNRGNGGLFGGNGTDGAGALGATLRNPPEQNQANMDLMQAVGAVDKAVAVSTAAMEASQNAQTIGITNQFNSTTGSLVNRIDGVKDAVNGNSVALMQQLNAVNTQVLQTANDTQTAVYNDGDKTRALITAQYEASLNRQLSDANAAVIALQNRFENAERSRGIEVTTTNNINQMQQQTQQQTQYSQLYHAIYGLAQGINATNQAINVGTGTQTANPLNNNTNIR